MSAADYLPFLDALGWLAAFAVAALWPSVPGVPGQRHAGWLIAFCASRLLVEAEALLFPGGDASLARQAGDWRHVAAILSGTLLWEFARRLHNERAGRRISAATHLVAAEILALMLAVRAPSDSVGVPDWFVPIELGAWFLPAALGVAAGISLWRATMESGHARKTWPLRLAAVGLAAQHTLPAIPGIGALSALPPWLVVAGLGAAVLALPAARTRMSLSFGGALLLSGLLGPLAMAVSLATVAVTERHDLLGRGQHAAAAFPRTLLARLEAQPDEPTVQHAVERLLTQIRESDPLVRAATVWRLRDGQRWNLQEPFAAAHRVTTEEQNGTARPLPFVLPATAERPLIAVHVPLRISAAHSTTAWLTLEYPDAFWAAQRRAARRNGVALVGLLAAFCAIGFVLACRQAIENAHRIEIERAQSADKAKTEFLAFLSHEMRTPLQTILGRTELLQAADDSNESARRHAAAIETQGRLLLRLVTDLLDLGTLEAGKFQLRPAAFSLRQTIAAVEDTVRAAATAKGLAVHTEIADAVADTCLGDEARVRQILGNLLGNAVKYTARGQVRLMVTVESADAHALAQSLVFRVTDTGPGLPPEKIPQLFTLFTRLDAGDTFAREGTGVGLALVRRLCDLMGGSVAAENRPEGGVEFVVRLTFPLVRAPAAEPIAAAAPTAAPRRVLVAEDNGPAREFLIEALESLGCFAEGAADGHAAFAAIEARPFDVVILDVNLPGRDGINLAAALARRPHRPRLIGCSAEAFAHTREAALAAGMDAFLEKPVTVAALASALAETSGTANPTPDTANLFERLRAPALMAQARATLAGELPATLGSLQGAVARRDFVAIGQVAHRLQSTALLADDRGVAELCRRLEQAAAAQAGDAVELILEE